jgi:hypothetical protein
MLCKLNGLKKTSSISVGDKIILKKWFLTKTLSERYKTFEELKSTELG